MKNIIDERVGFIDFFEVNFWGLKERKYIINEMGRSLKYGYRILKFVF